MTDEEVLTGNNVRFDTLSDLTPDELDILAKRARELAHPVVDESGQTRELMQLLTFYLAGEVYAVPVNYVQEVRPLKKLTRVPCAPDFVVGVLNLRGNILSLIDIRKFFGIAGQELTDLLSVIVVRAAGLEVGLPVYKVGEMVMMPRDEFSPPPVTVNGVDAEYIEAVSSEGLILLNLRSILGDPRVIVNDGAI